MKAIATPYCFHRIRGRIEVSQLCGRRSNLTGNKSPFVITFSYRDSIARSRNVELKIRHVKCCRDSKIYVQDEILFYISVSLHRLSVDFFLAELQLFRYSLFCNYLDNFNNYIEDQKLENIYIEVINFNHKFCQIFLRKM